MYMKDLMALEKGDHTLNLSRVACSSLMVCTRDLGYYATLFETFAEPGYYEDGSFGIRIENVELIKKTETKYKYDGLEYLTMEPVTLVGL